MDFSLPAIEAARADSAALGIPARFVHADLYDAPAALPEPASFDLRVHHLGHDRLAARTSTAGRAWSPISCNRAAGSTSPTSTRSPLVFDDQAPEAAGRPGWFAPYFLRDPLEIDDPSDYADPHAQLQNARTVQFMHPLAAILAA